jgi:hypothetical protein
MAKTYTLIASTTVGSGGAADVTFSSIPGTYTDLLISVSARTNRSGTDPDDELRLSFNGATTGYATRMIEGNGSTVRSTADADAYFGRGTNPTDNSTANTFGNTEYYIPNYATSSNFKTVSFDSVMERNATASYLLLVAGRWVNNNAITSCKLSAIGTFEQYSTFYLYGIKNS